SFGSAVTRFLIEQSAKRAERGGFRDRSGRESRVNVCHPSSNQRKTKSVHDNVVITRIPEETVRRRLEQRIRQQRTMFEVTRLREIRFHPVLRGLPRSGLSADIDE